MPQSNLHFSISERKLYLRFLDVVFPIIGFYLVSLFTDYQYFNFNSPQILKWSISLSIYILFFGVVFEMYNLKVASDKYLTLRSALLTSLFATLFYVFTPYFSPLLPSNRIQIFYFFGVLLVSILVNRFIYIQFIFSPRFIKNILIIAEIDEIETVIALNEHKNANKIIAYVSDKKMQDEENLTFIPIQEVILEDAITHYFINEIIVTSKSLKFLSKKINNQLIELFEKGVIIRSIDNFIEEETNRVSEGQLTPNFYNYFTFSKSHQNNLYLTFRRIFDVFFAIIGILFFLILIPIVFLINLIANKGKLLYVQKRIGKRGIEFNIFKFRTMVSNAEKNGAEWAQKNDQRITPFGRILRKSRIDEVPQFLNVFSGDMSLIGPRPERPEFVKQLENELPFYAIRHVIKPGLTGWAQVMHPYANTVEDQHIKLMYDLYYIKERNLLLDFKIVIKTISTILFFRGT